MRDIPREIAEDYQEFFDFLNQEHNLILTISEMDELVFEAQNLVKKLSLGVVVGQSEQLKAFDELFDYAWNLAQYPEEQAKLNEIRERF